MRVQKFFTLAVVLFTGSIGFSCQAKNVSAAPAVTEEEVIVAEAPKKDLGRETEPECLNPSGPDSLRTRQEYSLYREDFQRGKYADALVSWRYVYQNAPCFREQTLADGIYMMKNLADNTKDSLKKRAYADTMLQVYDVRLRLFGQKASVIGRKGRDMFKYFPERRKEAMQLMKETLDKEGNGVDEYLLSDLMLAYVQENKAKDGTVKDDEVIDVFDRIITIVGTNLGDVRKKYNDAAGQTPVNAADTTKHGKQIRVWEYVEGYVLGLGGPYLTCEKVTQIYSPKFKANPNDGDLLPKILVLLERSPGCTKTDFYLEVAEQNFKMKPDAAAAAALARAFREKNQDAKAKSYYEKAAELETDNSKKAEYYTTIAQLELAENNCTAARTWARRSLDINSKNGEAYLVIGNAYMSCASGCGADEFEKSYAFLAAYDKFIQAKTVDASVADRANARMAIAQNYFPSREDGFFRSITEGQSVNTGCWIGETTTIRFKK